MIISFSPGFGEHIICESCADKIQSERNKVLDEVIEFLKSKQNISPFTELYYHAAIEEIDKELRQAGE